MINSVLHGDCLELMKDIPDGSIDMILCDLPYGTTACKWDVIIPFDLLWAQYKRIVKPNAAIVLTASQPFTSQLVMSNPKWFKYEWIWVKSRITGFANAKKQPLRNCESCLVFANNKAKYFPQNLIRICKSRVNGDTLGGESLRGDILRSKGRGLLRTPGAMYEQEFTNYPKQSIQGIRDDFDKLHPTQKPVALFEYLIKTYTNEGDLILDNCAGSGTTAVAAINTNRNYILMEKESKYIEVINQRLGNHEPSPALTFPPQPQQLTLFA